MFVKKKKNNNNKKITNKKKKKLRILSFLNYPLYYKKITNIIIS